MPKQIIVPGHHLPFEGKTKAQWMYRSGVASGSTKCSCGVESPVLPTIAARQRWHREHKLDVLATAGASPGSPQK